jgi:dGTPase
LFNYYVQNYEQLPEFYLKIARKEGIERGVADYISGMTDNYCIMMFENLVMPRSYVHVK